VPSETTAAVGQDRLSPRQVGRGAFRPHSMDSDDDGNASDSAMDEGHIAHAPAASSGLPSAARPPSSDLRPTAGSPTAFRDAQRRGGSPGSPAPLGADAAMGWATRDLASRPNSPPRRAASPPPPEWAQSSASEQVESDDEFWDRHRKTGAIARLVTYSIGESPQDDILGLACTKSGGIMVTSLKKDGPAMRADVKSGDLLASVNGLCPPKGTSAKAIKASLRSPANLVFMGFVGKLQAEVRVKYPTVRCGMPEGINVGSLASLHGHGQRPGLRFQDAVVWHQPATSLFVAASRREGDAQDAHDADGIHDGYLGSIFELKREDAKCILGEVLRSSRSAAAGSPPRNGSAEESSV